jgi:hypothetical protein
MKDFQRLRTAHCKNTATQGFEGHNLSKRVPGITFSELCQTALTSTSLQADVSCIRKTLNVR